MDMGARLETRLPISAVAPLGLGNGRIWTKCYIPQMIGGTHICRLSNEFSVCSLITSVYQAAETGAFAHGK